MGVRADQSVSTAPQPLVSIDFEYTGAGHVHGRLARLYGDMSSNIPANTSAAEDWDNRGVTYLTFEYYKPALEGASSPHANAHFPTSRTIDNNLRRPSIALPVKLPTPGVTEEAWVI